jgi:hypothetical protein
MPGAGLAQLVGLPKSRADPASQPLGIDAEGLTQVLERERTVAVAALDPGEIATERATPPVARRKEATQAVLEHREPELKLAGELSSSEADGHAAPSRLVGRLAATTGQLPQARRSKLSEVSAIDGPVHTFSTGYTDRDA